MQKEIKIVSELEETRLIKGGCLIKTMDWMDSGLEESIYNFLGLNYDDYKIDLGTPENVEELIKTAQISDCVVEVY